MSGRHLLGFLFVFCASAICLPQMAIAQTPTATVLLSDDFTRDENLNQNLWTVNPLELGPVAQGLRSVVPDLNFLSEGMKMSGVSSAKTFAGIRSNGAFTPPFTVEATVMGTVSHGNTFVIFLMTSSGQSLRITGNLDPANVPAYSTAVSVNDQRGKALDGHPSINKWYTITIKVDRGGNASVTVADEKGSAIGMADGLSFTLNPTYIALAQTEFTPRVSGPNSAIWRRIVVTAGTERPSNQIRVITYLTNRRHSAILNSWLPNQSPFRKRLSTSPIPPTAVSTS